MPVIIEVCCECHTTDYACQVRLYIYLGWYLYFNKCQSSISTVPSSCTSLKILEDNFHYASGAFQCVRTLYAYIISNRCKRKHDCVCVSMCVCCVCACACMCVCVCMRTCVCMCMCVCMRLCVGVCQSCPLVSCVALAPASFGTTCMEPHVSTSLWLQTSVHTFPCCKGGRGSALGSNRLRAPGDVMT